MAQYRDELDAARRRAETLEAQLAERDASLRAREAEISELRAASDRRARGDAPLSKSRPLGIIAVLLGIAAIAGLIFGLQTSVRLSQERAEHARADAERTVALERIREEMQHTRAEQERAERELEALRRELEPPTARPRLPEPPPPEGAPIVDPRTAGTLNMNSIPVSEVRLDGRLLGRTPKAGVRVSAGVHDVVFVHPDRGTKSISVDVKAGETKTAAVRF